MTGYSNIKTKLKKKVPKFPHGGYIVDSDGNLISSGAGGDDYSDEQGYVKQDNGELQVSRPQLSDPTTFNSQLPTNAASRALLKAPSATGSDSSNGSAISTAGNLVGDSIESFNNGGTGGGSVALSTLGGAAKGAATGAAVGSVVPVIGTAIGAVAGGLIGGVTGFVGGKKKQAAAINERDMQQDAYKSFANRQSGQILRQYANNGVQDEQLYADGGLINTYMRNHPLLKNRKIDDSLPYFSTPVIQPEQNQSYADGGDINQPPVSPPLSDKFKLEWNGMQRQMQKDGVAGQPSLDSKNTAIGTNYLKNYALTHHTTQLSPDSVTRVQDEMNGLRNSVWNLKQKGIVKQPVDNPNQFFPNQSKPDGWLGSKTSQEQFPSYFVNGKNMGLLGVDLQPHGTIDPQAVDPGVNVVKPEALAMKKYGGLLKRRFDDGGNPTQGDWEAEGSEVIQGQDAQPEQSTQLASDMQQINGPSHEQGGVQGTGGERIFSDRLKVSPVLQSVLRTNGIKIKGNSTYADVSNKLGKLKGKFEDKTDGVGKQTANVMLPRIEQSINDTFNDQEAMKNAQAYKKFAKGGVIKKYDDGGNLAIKNLHIGSAPAATAINDGIYTQGTPVPQGSPLDDSNTPSTWDSIKGYVNDNQGQIGNLGNYFANLGSINKLNTSVNPQLVADPNYNYVDRSGTAYSRNNALLHTGVKSLTNSGQTVNASNIGALYSKTLEGNAYINANENQRHDAYNEAFDNRADKINGENVSILNKATDDSRDLNNQKVALRLGARNAFQTGVVGNIAQKQAADLEQKKLLTVLASNDQNGVMSRFLTNYPKYKKLLSQYNSTSN